MAADVDYTARFRRSERYERARVNTFDCPIYRDGALVAPTQSGSTLTIYDAGGTAVVDAVGVTVADSIAEVAAPAQTSRAYEDGWVWEWSLVLGSVTRVFRNTGALVRNDLAPPASDQDLFDVMSSLDPSGSAPITSKTDFQGKRDVAWNQIWKRIEKDRRHPWRIVNAAELLHSQVLLTLTLIFEDEASRLKPAFMELALHYRRLYEAEWSGVQLLYDDGDTGQTDSDRRSARRGGFNIGPGTDTGGWGRRWRRG
jgi:hypothetical protein